MEENRKSQQSELEKLSQEINSEITNIENVIEKFYTVTKADEFKHACTYPVQALVALCSINIFTLSVPVYAAVSFAFPENPDYTLAVAAISWISSAAVLAIAAFVDSDKPYNHVYETSKERKNRNKYELEEKIVKKRRFLEREIERIKK